MSPFADRYPSAARAELRSDLFWLTTVCAAGAVVLVWSGATQLHGWQAGAAYVGAGALLAVVWGFRTFRAWTRWVVAAVAVCAVLGALASLVVDGVENVRQLGGLLARLAFWGSIAAYFASPSTGRRFALARSRWVPRSAGGKGGYAVPEDAPPPD